tara:strand:- start:5248 stop:6030 length:783 start_codon:yes stop_codon:yes gene_type:complete
MSTLEQQEVNVQSEQPTTNEGFVEDIVNEQAMPEEMAVPQEQIQEEATLIDYEAESKKFQSMYDRSQAENAKLQQGAQILQLLEQRPDLVEVLENGIAQSPAQQQRGPEVTADDFNPWELTQEGTQTGDYFASKMNNMIDQRVNSKIAQQQQQMQAEMQMQNTVNELRGTYKMSDGDIQEFLQFTTQPKEQVGLNNLVKLWQMQGGKSVVNNDTMEAVSAAKQAPRTAGVLQGQSPEAPRNDADKVFDSIMGTGSGSALP